MADALSVQEFLSFEQRVRAVIQAVIVGQSAYANPRQLQHLDYRGMIRENERSWQSRRVVFKEGSFKVDQEHIQTAKLGNESLEWISQRKAALPGVAQRFPAQHEVAGESQSNCLLAAHGEEESKAALPPRPELDPHVTGEATGRQLNHATFAAIDLGVTRHF